MGDNNGIVISFDEVEKSVSLDYLINHLDNGVDFTCDKDLSCVASLLNSLASNKLEVLRIVCSFFKNSINDAFNPYTEQTLLIYSGKNYSIRLNVWQPIDDLPHIDNANIEGELYAYNLPHDHNFSFLTVGLWGEGYLTDTYRYNYSDVKGFVGEIINIKPYGVKRLSKGSVHFYRESLDIHVQIPPSNMSVSLNVLIDIGKDVPNEQFRFDILSKNKAKIIALEESRFSGDIIPTIQMLKELNCNDINEFVWELSKCSNHYIRREAYNYLLDEKVCNAKEVKK